MNRPERAETRCLAIAVALACATAFAAMASPAQAREVIHVSPSPGPGEMSIYDAIGNPAHEGAQVILAAGTYVLDPARGSKGRLELQKDMAVEGAHRTETIIDASALNLASHYRDPAIPVSDGDLTTGPIRLGRGNQSLEWVTVIGVQPVAAAAITTDLPGNGPAQVRIAHVNVSGAARGIDIRNIGSQSTGRTLQVALVENVIRDNTQKAGLGVRLANIETSHATILATLDGNEATGNNIGCLAANLDSSDSIVSITSKSDVFSTNGIGCALIGGLSSKAQLATMRNAIIFDAQGGYIQDNARDPPASFPVSAGFVAMGGQRTGPGSGAFDNSVDASLQATKIGGNRGTDVAAYGAAVGSDATVPEAAGTGNIVRVELRGGAKKADVALPQGTDGTNTVTIVR